MIESLAVNTWFCFETILRDILSIHQVSKFSICSVDNESKSIGTNHSWPLNQKYMNIDRVHNICFDIWCRKRWLWDLSSWLVSKRCQVGALFSFLLHRTLRGSHNLVKYWLWEIFYYFYCSSRFRWGNLSNISTFYFINRLFMKYWNLKK